MAAKSLGRLLQLSSAANITGTDSLVQKLLYFIESDDTKRKVAVSLQFLNSNFSFFDFFKDFLFQELK